MIFTSEYATILPSVQGVWRILQNQTDYVLLDSIHTGHGAILL